MTDEELIARLRSKILVHTDVAVWILEAADRIETLAAQLESTLADRALIRADCDDLAKVIDANETSHGLSSGGNMWRFWAEKAGKLASSLDAARAELARVTALLREARIDLEGYVDADWPENLRARFPIQQHKWERDMALCWQIDAALTAQEAAE